MDINKEEDLFLSKDDELNSDILMKEIEENFDNLEIEEVKNNNIMNGFLTQDIFGDYMKRIIKSKICTKEEEQEYFKKIRNGDKEAYEEFIERNQKLIVHIAKKYASRATNYEMMDLVQQGNLGLMKAIEKFEIERGYKFSTYAVSWIKQSIMRGIENTGYSIRLPSYAYTLYKRALKEVSIDYMENGEIVDWISIKNYLEKENANECTIKGIELFHNNINNVSLEKPLLTGDDDITLMDALADTDISRSPESMNIQISCKESILKALNELTEKERDILLMRFGFETGTPMTLEEIGQKFGVTRERIRQIEKQCLGKLRRCKFRDLREYRDCVF